MVVDLICDSQYLRYDRSVKVTDAERYGIGNNIMNVFAYVKRCELLLEADFPYKGYVILSYSTETDQEM